MKWILIIFIFLTSCITVNQEAPNQPGVHNYSGTIYKLDLNIATAIQKQFAPNATIYIEYDQPLEYGIVGLANQLDEHTYLIQLSRQNPQPLYTLLHEFGHIIDAERGLLGFKEPYTWNGKVCNFKQPWDERPWEQSANVWRDSLFNVYENGQLEHYDYTTERFLKALKFLNFKTMPLNSVFKDSICQ